MKLIKIFFLVVVAGVAGLSASRVAAEQITPVSSEQALNFSIVGTYQGTNSTNGVTVTSHVKTILITSQNIVKAIASDIFLANTIDTNKIFGGTLIRKVGLGTNANVESIVIRKGTNETDVTSFFNFTTASNFTASNGTFFAASNPFTNDFSVTSQIVDSSIRLATNGHPAITNHFIASALRSVSLRTTNISFDIWGFGTVASQKVSGHETPTTMVSGEIEVLTANGVGTFSLNINNYTHLATNNVFFQVSGPAHGTFTTSIPSVSNLETNFPPPSR